MRRVFFLAVLFWAAAAGAGAARLGRSLALHARAQASGSAAGLGKVAGTGARTAAKPKPKPVLAPKAKPASAPAPKQRPAAASGGGEDDAASAGAGDEAFRAQVRDFRKLNSPKKLVKAVEELSEAGRLDQNMTVYAFRTLQRMNRSDLCCELHPLWLRAVQESPQQQVELEPATAMLRSYCRLNRTDLAESVAEAACASLGGRNDSVAAAAVTLLPELAYGHLLSDDGSGSGCEKCLSLLFRLQLQHPEAEIDLELSKAILKAFVRAGRGTADVRAAVRVLLRLQGLSDNDSLQLLTSAFMRSVDFVKGAVSMQTLPDIPAGPPRCNEAAFIGRSNVGKSSLINMIANRKGLAFTSKTPGKTSEFNYFDSNGTVGRKAERHRFFLVDLPGVGYAEVSRDLKESWLKLLREYVCGRPNLRALFHLVDSRHGLLDADYECLDLIPTLPAHVQYCIVLTKADKRGGGGALRPDLLDRIHKEIQQRSGGRKEVPVVLTSADARTGGVDVWSVLLDSLAAP